MRLIKIVDREQDSSLRSGESAEVAQMGIAAALHPIPVDGVDDKSDAIIGAAPR
jgi:hypothetical protein